MTVRVQGLHKQFGAFRALHDVSFDVAEGELVAILGPSGGGKSTILRLIAGLDTPDAGSISLDGEVMDGVPARKRRVGFVFQHYALFRHMSIAGNVAFGLESAHVPRHEREK